MANRRSTPLPAALGGAPLRTVRAKDAGAAYAYPGPELARLADQGLLLRVANGYYVVVPQDMVGRVWVPDLDAVAAGIASAIYGPDRAVLMGISAARVLGAIPRALATAIAAVPKQHRPIQLNERSSVVRFVKRDTDGLDVERIETPLGPALVTTPEQTVLDLAHRPQLGDAGDDVPAAVAALYGRSDIQRLDALAADQRLTASLRRAQSWAGAHRGQG
ncbi:type IV toxin-antitoxin system AbiEi family antitoxin domain-containing protein [Mycolicibacterium moriokaense]|uniref:Transcriptional regulator with AbiEi antitoxin domain of type IV toxin-antitoxin system n=1 Tax=Mycolicibacterium moriokaense TaxID=39691 RepID=A0A318HHQ1_9MYCO|nr:type IV toxin-antitoxin system AbiEi family antitoxin [Mycolicibacterium moriokaense]PXX09228.1 transcriptional regulator with AbiEi antitoxin domain of type IV toxin-antitoxin system [Mycolicibacterium moriokaense]